MLTNATHLTGLSIQAKDGDLGTVSQFYFDDETWGVRYLVVNTGGWLSGREVLISPLSITSADWPAKRLHVDLTKQQVADSPGIDTHMPISRHREAEYMGYFGYPYYWGNASLWGPSWYPGGLLMEPPLPAVAIPARTEAESVDSHLRSNEAVIGYAIEAQDGDIGHLRGFLVDDKSWAIRYLEVATRNWWPGKKVLLSPGWIERVSWEESRVCAGLTREAIQTCPEYTESMPVDREYEDRIFLHYGRPPYWLHEQAGTKSALDLIGV